MLTIHADVFVEVFSPNYVNGRDEDDGYIFDNVEDIHTVRAVEVLRSQYRIQEQP